MTDVRPIPIEELRALRHATSERKQQSLTFVAPSWQEGQPVRAGQSFVAAVREGWRRNELIYACVQAHARAAASVRLRLIRARTGDEIATHPLVTLLRRPNPHMDEAMFHAARRIYQLLSGHSYWEVVRSRAGQPVELWPLRPDWVRPIIGRQGLLGWEYAPPGVPSIRLRPDQVIDFPVFDPLSLFGGTSPAVVAGYAVDTDNAVSRFAKDFFERGALPAGLLTTTQRLLESDIERLRAQWQSRYGGAANWVSAPAIIDSEASYQRISMSADEMGIEALDSRNEARICMVLGVPPIIIGANVGLERATYSNYAEARASWWQDTLVPMLRQDAARLRLTLLPEFGDDLDLEWDLDEVPALQEDASAIWTRAREALASGGITVNEFRDLLGLEQVPGGDVFLRPLTLAPVSPDTDLTETPPAPESASTPEADTASDTTSTPEARAHAGADETKDRPPDDDLRQRRERALARDLDAFFAAELDRIARELRRNGPR